MNIFIDKNMKILLSEEHYKNLPNSSPFISNEKFELLKKFIVNCKKELGVKKPLQIKMKAKRDGELATFAHYDLSSGEICVYVKDRHIGDIMRSVAHELKHVEQHLKGMLNADSGNDGSPHENEANSFAGIMMRKFGKDFPEIYEDYNSDKVVINEDKNSATEYIAYHASNEYFTDFDVAKISNLRGDLYGKGFYFTNNYNYAKKFGTIMYECKITLNNPIDLTNDSKAKIHLLKLLSTINDISEYDEEYINDSIKYKNFTSAFRKIRKYCSFMELRELFDGVIGYSEEGGREYVVYNSKDIEILDVVKL